jgi:hypothetical protein
MRRDGNDEAIRMSTPRRSTSGDALKIARAFDICAVEEGSG